MDYWKKQNIDSFLVEIENYYSDCSVGYFQNQGILDKINKEECKYLNDNLNLSKIVGVDSSLILNQTLRDKEKDNFSFYLLKSKKIELEVNCLDELKKTVFIRLSEKYFFKNNGSLINVINELFLRNYKIKEEDLTFVNKLYKKISCQDDLEKWSILRFAVKLNDAEKFTKALKKENQLFVILSLKFNKPIHFRFPNLLGVLNNAIQHYRENGEIILKAMNYYGRTNQINELDLKKGVFRKKNEEYELNKPIQDKEFEEIVQTLFPELK